jgi:hypothetical protein
MEYGRMKQMDILRNSIFFNALAAPRASFLRRSFDWSQIFQMESEKKAGPLSFQILEWIILQRASSQGSSSHTLMRL